MLLNMTTPEKTLCNVRTFSFKNKAYTPICKLLNTIYEQYIDKQEWKRIFYIVSCVKHQLFFVWQHVTYVTNFKNFYLLLNSLNDTS